MPTPRKPAQRRQGRAGTADLGLVVPVPVSVVPDPPGDELLPETVAAWEEFWTCEELATLVKPGDRQALRRLFRLYDLRARLETVAMAQPIVEGSQGQPRANPALDKLTSIDAQIVALEDRFGMSPKARLSLGVTFGQAARSLADLNDLFHAGGDAHDEDPRLSAIEIETTGAADTA